MAFWITYGPLVLWGPLLWIVTVHYWRRRTAFARPSQLRPKVK